MDYIKIGGKDRPIVFNYRAISRFMRAEGFSMSDALNDVLGNMDLLNVTNLTYWGLRVGAEKQGLGIDFTIEGIEDWIDEDPKAMGRVLELFAEASFWEKLNDEEGDDEGKANPSASAG